MLLQSKVLKVYPYKYWSSMVTCLVGGFQTALVGIILNTDKNAWKLGWNLVLVTILYSVSRLFSQNINVKNVLQHKIHVFFA